VLTAICSVISSCSKVNHGLSKETKSAYYQKENSTYKKKNFDSLMSEVEKTMSSGLDTYKGLLFDKAFVELFDHSPSYYDDVTRLLSEQDVTNIQAIICVLAMQHLNLDDYIKLCGFYIKLNDRNKISEDTIERLIGGFLDIHIIPENYDDPKVIGVLNAFKNNRKTSATLKTMIDDILAGK